MIQINDKLKIYFPLKLNPRKQQIEALEFTKNVINNGNKYCCLNLSMGVGKSYYAMMFINWYLNTINENAKFDILTNSKILQKQYIKEFPFIKNYEGRSNYHCDVYDGNCSTSHEICKIQGPHCTDCPYEIAKKAWQSSEIGLTNFHLFNTIALYVRTILDGRDSNVLIIDESHDFEEVFCNYISVDICSKSLKKYGFDLKEIEDYEHQLSKLNNIGKFIGFIKNQFINDIKNKMFWLDEMVKTSTPKIKKQYADFLQYCESQKLKLDYLIKEFEKTPDNWILETSNIKNRILLEAKPIWGNMYIKEKIFEKYDHVIFLSATILEQEMFSHVNGLEKELTKYFELPTPFQLKNRPIYYIKCGKMTYDQKVETFKNQIKYIDKILNKYKDKKGIIHANSYEFVEMLQKQYINKRLLFHTPDNRDEMLQKHIDAKYPSVIVSPSMISGVDLKDDISRFQVILKIPFPFLGSEKIKKRMNKKDWYNYKTVCDLMQSCGRSVRSFDDYADTFILDNSFSDVLKYSSKFLPRWFTDSIRELKI